MILLDHVSKEFHKKNGVAVPAIHAVSLHIPEGTVVGVIGASGSGKTTLLKLTAGLLQPSSGRVRVGDRDPVVNRKRCGDKSICCQQSMQIWTQSVL